MSHHKTILTPWGRERDRFCWPMLFQCSEKA